MGKSGLLAVALLFLFMGCSNDDKQELLRSGISEKVVGNFRGAIVYLRKALEHDPNFYEARFHLGDSYLQAGQYLPAEKELLKVQRQNPGYNDLPLKLAQIYNHTQRHQESVKLLNSYLEEHPPTAVSMDILGVSLSLGDKPDEASRAFRRASELDPQNPLPKIHLAQTLLVEGYKDKSMELLSSMLVEHARFAPAYELLAELEMSMKHLDSALDIYTRLSRIAPDNIQALYMRGILALLQGDKVVVQEVVATFKNRFQNDERGQQLIGLLDYDQGDYKSASITLRKAVRHETMPLSTYFLGLSHYQLAEYELAVSQFQRVLDIKPDLVPARVLLAMTFFKQNRLEDAERQAEYVVSVDPDNALARSLLGNIYLEQKAYSKAITFLSRSAELDSSRPTISPESALIEKGVENVVFDNPTNLYARLAVARKMLRQDEPAQAAQLLSEGLTDGPADALIYLLLAEIAQRGQQEEVFVEHLKNAIAANSSWETASHTLATHYLIKGEIDRAIDVYSRLLAKNQESVESVMALALLHELRGKGVAPERLMTQLNNMNNRKAIFTRVGVLSQNHQYMEAIRVVDQALSSDRSSLELSRVKFDLYRQSGDLSAALSLAGEIENAAPGAGTTLAVDALVSAQDLKKAKLIASQVMQKDNRQPLGYLLLATIQEAEGDSARALKTIEEGLSVDPENVDFLTRQVLLYDILGKHEEALKRVQLLAHQFPGNFHVQFINATLNERSGYLLEARRLYERTLEINPRFVPALNNLALLYLENEEKVDDALALTFKAYRQAPFESGVLDTLGMVLEKFGRHNEAVAAFEMAYRFAKGNPTISFHLGQSLLNINQPDQAKRLLREAMQSGKFADSGKCQALLSQLGG